MLVLVLVPQPSTHGRCGASPSPITAAQGRGYRQLTPPSVTNPPGDPSCPLRCPQGPALLSPSASTRGWRAWEEVGAPQAEGKVAAKLSVKESQLN